MYYVRITLNDTELIKTHNYATLKDLTFMLNSVIDTLDLSDSLLFKLFKDHNEIGYFQLAPDGLYPVDSKELIIEA